MAYQPNIKIERVAQWDATTGAPTDLAFQETFFSPNKKFKYGQENWVRPLTSTVNAMNFRITNTSTTSGVITVQSALSGVTNGSAVAFISADGFVAGVGVWQMASLTIAEINWSSKPPAATTATFATGYYVALKQAFYPWETYVCTWTLAPTALSDSENWVANGMNYAGKVYLYHIGLDIDSSAYRCVPSPYTPLGDAFFIASSTQTFQPNGAAFSTRQGLNIQ